jgi:cell fate (sporulation/competence/biofilm development) regulator YlbF (YheA/YmcA/DUF963 family)
MNIYDTANKLAAELKQTDEYKAYKNSKQQIESNAEVKSKIDEFDKLRVEAQKAMLKGEANANELSVKLQNLYTELYQNEIAKNYLESEMRFSVMVTDINKIISEAIKDVIG